MREDETSDDAGGMRTYAVKWREPEGATYLGRLELDGRGIRLEGRATDGARATRALVFEEVLGFRMGAGADERLDGRVALVVEGRHGNVLVASTVVQAGILQELVHRLSELHLLVR